MGLDSSNLAASIGKSQEIERSPGGTQRGSDVSQEQIAGESVSALHRMKPDAAEHLRQARIRQERERRRRELERRMSRSQPDSDPDGDAGSGLDVVV
jgi:hypothetical protein